MPRLPMIVLAFAAALTSFGGAAQSNSLRNCIAQTAELDLFAKTAFQAGMRDLIVQEAPQFAALADFNKELQISVARSRQLQLQYLLSTDPERLVIGANVSKLTNFEWSETDTILLSRLDSKFRELHLEIDTLQDRNNGHKDWPSLRQFVAEVLSKDSDYAKLLARFQKQRGLADNHFAGCRGGQ